MGQKLETKNSTYVGTMNHRENGHAIAFHEASTQFHTRSCARCAGLLVRDWCYDLINTGEHNAEVFRCVQCGNRVDPVILENQVRVSSKHAHPNRFASPVTLGKAA